MKSFATNMWDFAKTLKVVKIGVNLFQMIFENTHDKEKVLNGRLWVFDNQPLVLPWKESIETDERAFKKTWIWVQIWNLPIHWITKEVRRKIGGVFLSSKDVIIPKVGSNEGKHVKILVKIDLTQPLIRGTTVKMNGIIKWIDFKYEKCSDFCYCCGIMGHSEKNCKVRGRPIDEEAQFGAWPRASTTRSPAKKQSIPKHSENDNTNDERNSNKNDTKERLMLTWKPFEYDTSVEELRGDSNMENGESNEKRG